jgi:hypothetical protein
VNNAKVLQLRSHPLDEAHYDRSRLATCCSVGVPDPNMDHQFVGEVLLSTAILLASSLENSPVFLLNKSYTWRAIIVVFESNIHTKICHDIDRGPHDIVHIWVQDTRRLHIRVHHDSVYSSINHFHDYVVATVVILELTLICMIGVCVLHLTKCGTFVLISKSQEHIQRFNFIQNILHVSYHSILVMLSKGYLPFHLAFHFTNSPPMACLIILCKLDELYIQLKILWAL